MCDALVRLLGAWALRSLIARVFRVAEGATEQAGAVVTIRGDHTRHRGHGCGSWYCAMGLNSENTPQAAHS